MSSETVIRRYFSLDTERWNKMKKDLSPLVEHINRSGGEYSLQLREDYFNIYYQGNSLAVVRPLKNGTYEASIHRRFAEGDTLRKLERYSINKPSQSAGPKGNYVKFSIASADIPRFFRDSNINSLSSRIRAVHNGEEITSEQMLITDNPPSEKFIIIDRQVADHVNRAQIDLLALLRGSTDKFHFQVIELKLGRNPELYEKVGWQLNKYVNHIRKYIGDYACCYEKNYRQKKELGLFPAELPTTIEIDRNENTVEGLVVACGYSGLAHKAVQHLRQKIEENQWDFDVRQQKGLTLS